MKFTIEKNIILENLINVTKAISSKITICPSFIALVIGPSTHSNKLLLFELALFW